MWVTYSGPQTGTGKHCSAGRVQLAQQQGLQASRQSVLEVDLDKARLGASPLRQGLVSATATPLRSAPHPLQMCKSNLSTISLHRRSHAERRLGSHYSVRALRSLSIPSAPEA